MKEIITALVTLLCITSIQGQTNIESIGSKADEILSELESREDIVGVSITVGLVDSIIYSKAKGLADRDLGVAAQSYHKFRIYSLSKHITAIAAAKLAEDGQLDLDKPIIEYIPFLDDNLKDVTSRQLIGHTAGIRSYDEGEWQKVSSGVCSSPFESILSFQSDSLLFSPGEDYSYTSFGYVLLSAVIEKVAGIPFIDFLQDQLFLPVGLTNITLDNADRTDHLAAKPYEYWKEVMYNARYANNTCKFGGGGLSASTMDVAKFNLALLNGEIVSDETLKMILTSMKLENGEETAYGFGLQFDTDKNGVSFAWHSGRSRGGRNALVLYPEEKLVVCISANTNGEGIVEEAEEIALDFIKSN